MQKIKIEEYNDEGLYVSEKGLINYKTNNNEKLSGSYLIADFSLLQINSFTIQFTDLSSTTVDIWSWDFGDGNTSNEQNPLHIYSVSGNFTVTLCVHYNSGPYDTCTSNSVVIIAPSIINKLLFNKSTNKIVFDNVKSDLIYYSGGPAWEPCTTVPFGKGYFSKFSVVASSISNTNLAKPHQYKTQRQPSTIHKGS